MRKIMIVKIVALIFLMLIRLGNASEEPGNNKPEILSKCDLHENMSFASILLLDDHYAYIIGSHFSTDNKPKTALLVVDINDIQRPTVLGSLDLEWTSMLEAVKYKNYVYLIIHRRLNQAEMQIVDVSNPKEPKFIKSINPVLYKPELIAAYQENLYIVGSKKRATDGNVLYRLSLADPVNPQISSTLFTDPVDKTTHRYFGGTLKGIKVIDGFLVVITYKELFVFDIRTENIQMVGQYDSNLSHCADITLSRSDIKNSDYKTDYVFALGGFITPSSMTNSDTSDANRMNREFGIETINLYSYRKKPVLGFDYGAANLIPIWSRLISSNGSYIYVFGVDYSIPRKDELSRNGCIYVFDFHRPFKPKFVSNLEIEGIPSDVKVINDIAYIITGRAVFQIVKLPTSDLRFENPYDSPGLAETISKVRNVRKINPLFPDVFKPHNYRLVFSYTPEGKLLRKTRWAPNCTGGT